MVYYSIYDFLRVFYIIVFWIMFNDNNKDLKFMYIKCEYVNYYNDMGKVFILIIGSDGGVLGGIYVVFFFLVKR